MEPIQTIGKLLTGGEERDCIHMAIFPAIAAEDGLRPGAEVGLVYGTTNQIKSMERLYGLPAIGIVDPFLFKSLWENRQYSVKKGDRVWVFLFPGTVTGMRHHWRHEALDTPHVPKNESEKWLREFADKWNFNYDEMIAGAQEDEGYVVAMGIDLHSSSELAPGDEGRFWDHIENITGRQFNQKHRETFGWSCSC